MTQQIQNICQVFDQLNNEVLFYKDKINEGDLKTISHFSTTVLNWYNENTKSVTRVCLKSKRTIIRSLH